MANTVLIGGGSGLVGTRLAELLTARGDEVRLLSRSPAQIAKFRAFAWDTKRHYLDPAALRDVTHVINLAGAGIADRRWTDDRKAAIISSRTVSTDLLSSAIQESGPGVRAYISASAIGYYGDRGDAWVSEGDAPGDGFLSASVVAWEESVTQLAGATSLRTALVRTGIALAAHGGALQKMLLPTRLGVSGYFGTGEQWYSWIHLDDLCRVYIAAVDDERYAGPINAVSPLPVRNRTLAHGLAKAVSTPALTLPVPKVALELALGEMSHTILDSARVSAVKLIDELRFDFSYPSLVPALENLLA